MIFKVYYQVNATQVPIRENTQTIYVEADSVRSVRHMLKQKPYNVERVEEISGAYLEYEKQQEDFKVLELR
jgi:DNA-dependent RNA polymerase auxiliary subunit epsilon